MVLTQSLKKTDQIRKISASKARFSAPTRSWLSTMASKMRALVRLGTSRGVKMEGFNSAKAPAARLRRWRASGLSERVEQSTWPRYGKVWVKGMVPELTAMGGGRGGRGKPWPSYPSGAERLDVFAGAPAKRRLCGCRRDGGWVVAAEAVTGVRREVMSCTEAP